MKKDKLLRRATRLRKKGYSLREISEDLSISKSSAHLWLKNIVLNNKARKRIEKIRIDARLKANRVNHEKKVKRLKIARLEADKTLYKLYLNKKHFRLLCSLIYWCEGAKEDMTLKFSNSDPKLVKTFLYLLRKSFQIDEKKFRPIVHLHRYHDEKKQLCFWSKIMKIPLKQFMNSYMKPNTKKRINPSYQGCVNVTYYDASLSRELLAIAKKFFRKYGGVR